jgi:hypothetical protein
VDEDSGDGLVLAGPQEPEEGDGVAEGRRLAGVVGVDDQRDLAEAAADRRAALRAEALEQPAEDAAALLVEPSLAAIVVEGVVDVEPLAVPRDASGIGG